VTSDHRITSGLIADVLDTLERHGYGQGDDLHADRAIGLIGDLACIWESTRDHPAGIHPATEPPTPPVHSGPGGPATQDGAVLTGGDARTVLAALDIAAGWSRQRAELCGYCPDQSCSACELRLQDARTYDEMAGRLLQTAEPARAASPSEPEPDRLSQPAADREAGQ
jgi:hypothetical protein